MSLICFPISIGFMSHVDFREWPCNPVTSKGQGPSQGLVPTGPYLVVKGTGYCCQGRGGQPGRAVKVFCQITPIISPYACTSEQTAKGRQPGVMEGQ